MLLPDSISWKIVLSFGRDAMFVPDIYVHSSRLKLCLVIFKKGVPGLVPVAEACSLCYGRAGPSVVILTAVSRIECFTGILSICNSETLHNFIICQVYL